ncbi:MAG: hypothetical protein E7113_02385 [Bacteroidales bacterium]|nr:hypothetical protein [Bacteroidales bacterium]
MKKALAIMAAVLLPVLTWGQAQITTKKVKIGDFTQKTTKIVLSGNEFIDTVFKDEITARWRISPYEFCTLEEFNSLKHSEEYYFLIITNGQFKKDQSPTIQFMTLIKGGHGADKGINGMLEIVSLPVASAQFPSGREITYIPAFLDIIQEYTLDSMEKDANAYGGLTNYTANIVRSEDHKVAFSKDDLAVSLESLDEDTESFGKDMMLMEEDEVDALMMNGAENTLVSYVVAPFEPQNGMYCYKMLIDTQSHKLYYYKRHKITDKDGPGFLKEDLKRIYYVR